MRWQFFLVIPLGFVVFIVLVVFSLGFMLVIKPISDLKKEDIRTPINIYIDSSGHTSPLYDFYSTYFTDRYPVKMAAKILTIIYTLHRSVKAGRYVIHDTMSLWDILGKITRGEEDPIKVKVFNCLSIEECLSPVVFNSRTSLQELIEMLRDSGLSRKLGVAPKELPMMILAGVYEFYWSWPVERKAKVLLREIEQFWNEARIKKCKKLGLSPYQAYILASIVSEEYAKREEIPLIASVYLNRLRGNIPLQADPTIKYILKLRGMKPRRILKEDLQIESRFNTYKRKGLPPQPICPVEKFVIDSVLNAPRTNYMYFCRSEDTTGYHYFSVTFSEHLLKCKRYQEKLNELGIKR